MQNKESLQDKFKEFGAQPSDALWNSIASNLDKKRKKKIIWIWWIGSGFAATLIVGLGLSNSFHEKYKKHDVLSSYIIKKNETSKTEANLTVTTDELINLNKIEELNTPSKRKTESALRKTRSKMSTSTLKAKKSFDKQKNIQKIDVTNPIGLKNIAPTHEEYSIEIISKLQPRKLDLLTTALNQTNLFTNLEAVKTPRQFEFSLKALTFINVKNQEQTPDKTVFTDQTGENSNPNTNENTPGNTLGASYSMLENNVTQPNSFIKTANPLALRFGISTKLFNRFKIQSGLDFGWVNSKSITTDNNYRSSIFTIGIPLLFNFNIVNKRRFDINIIAGVVNDLVLLKQDKTLQGSALSFTKHYLAGIESGFSFDYKLSERLKLGIGTGLKYYYYSNTITPEKSIANKLLYKIDIGLIWKY